MLEHCLVFVMDFLCRIRGCSSMRILREQLSVDFGGADMENLSKETLPFVCSGPTCAFVENLAGHG